VKLGACENYPQPAPIEWEQRIPLVVLTGNEGCTMTSQKPAGRILYRSSIIVEGIAALVASCFFAISLVTLFA
jgi:hypothetical protein